MNQALYPVDKIEWCVYALYKQDTERIGTYCTIVTTYRHANMAQSLDGYLWAVSSLKEEKMRIRCLEDSHLEDIRPPLFSYIYEMVVKDILVICLFQLNLN